MKRKYRIFIALNGVMRRKKAWARTVSVTAIALTMLVGSATLLHTVNFFLNDYLTGDPAARGIEVGVSRENSEEVWNLIQQSAQNLPIVSAYAPFPCDSAKIENPQKVFAGEDLNTQSHGFGSLVVEHDQYFDARYLENGRWIRTGEKNVMIIPENFAPNLEDDTGAWNFQQEYTAGSKYIGKTITLTTESGNGRYTAKVIGTYDNLRSGTQSGTVILPFEDAQKFRILADFSDENTFIYFYIIVNEKDDVSVVMDELDRKLMSFDRDINCLSSPGTLETFADIAGFVGIAVGVFFVILAVILTHCGYGSILESRTAELGLYRALGYTQKEIKKNLVCEILLIGTGVMLITIAASGILIGISFGIVQWEGSRLLASMPLRLSWVSLLVSAILCMGVPLLGAGNAIRRLENREISEALKGS